MSCIMCASRAKHSIRILPLFTYISRSAYRLDIVRALYFVRPYRRIVLRKFCRNNVERPAVVTNDLLTCHRLDSRRTCNGSVYRARKLVSPYAQRESARTRSSVCNASALLLVNRLRREATREKPISSDSGLSISANKNRLSNWIQLRNLLLAFGNSRISYKGRLIFILY